MRTASTLMVLMLVCRVSAQETAPSYAKLKFLEPLVGTWTGPFTGDNGQKMECKCALSWAETKYAIVWTYAEWPAGSPGEITARGSGIIHWDPIDAKVKEYGVLADGLVITTYFRPEGDKIVGDRSAVDAKGAKTTSIESWTITAKEWTWAPVHIRDKDGKVLKEFPSATVKRVAQ